MTIFAENPPVKKALRKRKRMDEREAKEERARKDKPAPTVKLNFTANEDSVDNRPDSSSDEDDSPTAKFRRGGSRT